MKSDQDLPTLSFASAEVWEVWLKRDHAQSSGIWLKLAKQGSGVTTVSYAEALDVALCYGWIDGQKAPCCERFWLQRFTPRRPRSRWSKINREKAEKLISTGRMQPPGLQQVEAAQADGRWAEAYESQSVAAVPDDLREALAENEAAQTLFETLDSANRYAILYRIHNVKRAETRARKIADFVAMLARNETIHPRPAKTKAASTKNPSPSSPSKASPKPKLRPKRER